MEVFIVQQIIFREVIKCLGSFFQIIQFCPMFKSFSIACGDIGGNIDIEIISFMHKEQAYIETAPRDVIQFKYAENLQI